MNGVMGIVCRRIWVRTAGALVATGAAGLAGWPTAPVFAGTAKARLTAQTEASDDEALKALFRDPDAAAPQAAAYSAGDGRLRFVLDRSRPRFVLMQFAGDPEVWALRPSWGPRGDEFLTNDVGDVMVRISSLGGITVYGPLGANGGPASLQGRASALASPKQKSGTLQNIVEGSLRWFERVSHPSIRVEAAAGLPPALVHEALERVAAGMSRLPRGWFGQPRRLVRRVRVDRASEPSARLAGRELFISVTPGWGYAGRPSSAAVQRAFLAER